MKTKVLLIALQFVLGAWLSVSAIAQENNPAVAAAIPNPTPPPSTAAAAQTAAPPANSTPPPAAVPQRGAADLEKLVAPIALYPDPLIATILPASVYPLEIVQAARFVKDTNNLAKLDAQPWDDNVKAVARVPEVITKMNEDLDWTTSLGQAFLDQQEDVMTAIQAMRNKAQGAGTLKTSPEQVVVVTNTVVEKTVEQQVVYETNTIVQIQPSNPEVIYVPTYDPYDVYYPPPGYAAPLLTFAAGATVGAIIANNCDWHGGGVYVGPRGGVAWGGGWGGYHGDVDVDIDRDINRNVNINESNVNIQNQNRQGGQGQKWQPDQNRLQNAGAPSATRSAEARGWSSETRPTTTTAGTRATGTGTAATRPTTGTTATRPATGEATRRAPSTSTTRPTPGTGTATTRPTPSTSGASTTRTRPEAPGAAGAQRPTRTTTPSTTHSASRPSPSSSSAFSGMNHGASAHSAGARGAASRGGGGGGRGGGRR